MLTVAIVLMFAAAGLAAARFVLGPSDVDRVIAVDLLFAVAMGLCAGAALWTQRALFLDIAIGVGLVGFIATLAWSRLLDHAANEEAP